MSSFDWLSLGALVAVLAASCDAKTGSNEPIEPTPSTQAVPHPTAEKSTTLPYYDGPNFTPHWLKKGAPELKTFHRIPSFSLTNQDGQRVSEETFEGKFYIVDFFFSTCPGICAKMTRSMAGLQGAFADDDDVLFLSHSVTPDIDTPEVLKKYADKHGIRSGKWHLVTGDRKQIYDLGRKHYFVEEDLGKQKTDEDFLHTENFLLIDQDRHIRGLYNGLNRQDLKQLVEDVEVLKAQAPKFSSDGQFAQKRSRN